MNSFKFLPIYRRFYIHSCYVEHFVFRYLVGEEKLLQYPKPRSQLGKDFCNYNRTVVQVTILKILVLVWSFKTRVSVWFWYKYFQFLVLPQTWFVFRQVYTCNYIILYIIMSKILYMYMYLHIKLTIFLKKVPNICFQI